MKENTVFIVDDHNEYINLISKSLEAEGIHVLHSISPLSALRQIKEGLSPSVIIIDYLMPELTGLEFLREVKKTPGLQDTKFVFLTSYNDSATINEAFRLGADHYILKRLGRYDVALKIKRLLKGAQNTQNFIQQFEVTNILRSFDIVEVQGDHILLHCHEEIPTNCLIKIQHEKIENHFNIKRPVLFRVESCLLQDDKIIVKAILYEGEPS